MGCVARAWKHTRGHESLVRGAQGPHANMCVGEGERESVCVCERERVCVKKKRMGRTSEKK